MSVNAAKPPPLITECPNCQTRFRVGESQLQIAHGRVRCGACLAVFAGVDHLLHDESAPPPELPADSNGLESVLAELEGSPAAQLPDDAEKSPKPDAEAQSQADLQAADGSIGDELNETTDWTSVSVDTREFGRDTTQDSASVPQAVDEDAIGSNVPQSAPSPEKENRASLSDALTDEEALRWWLEDELPGAVDSGVFDAKPSGEEMVVQLSQLDAVQEEELDLRELIESGADTSNARALEELFEEDLDEETNPNETAYASVSDEDAENTNAETDTDTDTDTDKETDATTDAQLEPTNTAAQKEDLTEESDSQATDIAADLAADETEPLMSRAMANGTIAAAAERMTGTAPRVEKSAALAPLSEKSGVGPIALVESPHRSSVSEAKTDALPVADPKEPANPAGVWDSTDFAETPADLVEDISAEMAAAGQPVVEQEPSLLEQARGLLDRFLGHALALRLATLLAFVVLTGQILAWQFDDWSKTETMRPLYSGICSLLGCELPARRSLRDLQSRKLAVRSHPEKEGSLLVDALIINEANFEQPFPVIELQFMDMAQTVVEAYRLEPATYLDGELLGTDSLMAIRTPIHIDIDIPDPGPRAVNYQLQFR